MYRVKQLLGGKLSLRSSNAQVGETYSMIKALNKLTGLGMPCSMRIALFQAIWLSIRFQQQTRICTEKFVVNI